MLPLVYHAKNRLTPALSEWIVTPTFYLTKKKMNNPIIYITAQLTADLAYVLENLKCPYGMMSRYIEVPRLNGIILCRDEISQVTA